MKIKNVILAFSSMFLLAGCDEADVERALTQFKDENVRAIVGISEAKKQEIRDSIKNYSSEIYLDMNADVHYTGTNAGELNDLHIDDFFAGEEPDEIDYFSFEDNLLRFSCLGYEGIVKKENGEYKLSGSYFDFVGSYIANELLLVGDLFETYTGDGIFSFGLVDRLNSVLSYESSFNSNLGSTISVENQEWYKTIECYDRVNEGTFKIHITEPIIVRVQGVKVSYDSIELVYEDYLLRSTIMVASEKFEYQTADIGVNYNITVACSSLFSYNVDPEVIFAEKIPVVE